MPSLSQRFSWHDFRRPGWYHVTIECAVRGRNVLAAIDRDGRFEPTQLGIVAIRQWRSAIASSGGALVAHAAQCMPDHFHALVHVARALPRPLGSYVGAFKAAATSAARKELGLVPGASLWKPGFDWEIKRTPEEVAAARMYVEGNPSAAVEKRALRAKWGAAGPVTHRRLPAAWPESGWTGRKPAGELAEICGERPAWAGFGNVALLDESRLVPVRISRREPEERLARMEEKARRLAREGAVLVSPVISPDEKRILAAALRAGGKAIHVECRPIDRYYKPGPLRVVACKEGRFLALGPLPVREGRHPPPLTKPLAELLNAVVKEMVGGIGGQ